VSDQQNEDKDLLPLTRRPEVVTLPTGQHGVVVTNVVHREKNQFGNADFMFVFAVIDGPHKDSPVFYYAPAYLKVGKKLWNVLIMLGVDPKTQEGGIRKSHIIGKKANVWLEPNPKGTGNKVTNIFPFAQTAAPAPVAAAPAPAPAPVAQPAMVAPPASTTAPVTPAPLTPPAPVVTAAPVTQVAPAPVAAAAPVATAPAPATPVPASPAPATPAAAAIAPVAVDNGNGDKKKGKETTGGLDQIADMIEF